MQIMTQAQLVSWCDHQEHKGHSCHGEARGEEGGEARARSLLTFALSRGSS